MKNFILIVLVCIVLLFVSSYAKDDYKTIFVCDSLSNPTTAFLAVCNTNLVF